MRFDDAALARAARAADDAWNSGKHDVAQMIRAALAATNEPESAPPVPNVQWMIDPDAGTLDGPAGVSYVEANQLKAAQLELDITKRIAANNLRCFEGECARHKNTMKERNAFAERLIAYQASPLGVAEAREAALKSELAVLKDELSRQSRFSEREAREA